MDIEAAKKMLKKYVPGHAEFVIKADIAERYYKNENDILFKKTREYEEESENPLRNADNKISHNFHALLVNQKASYIFTYSPLFDIGTDAGNKLVKKELGSKFSKTCKSLCVNASNFGVAWLHYWVDDKGFHYGVVDSRQIIPVWTDDLEKKLRAVLRTYKKVLDDGKEYVIYEIWTETQCQSFCHEINNSMEMLTYYSVSACSVMDFASSETNVYWHDMGRVPFISFFNNDVNTSDLKNIKGLIDSYDKVYSGFMNDLEDIQEIIFLLSGYGGTDLQEFMQELKKYKTVKLDGDEDNPGLSTLTIDIPVEAREKMLVMTRKAIFEQGQGIDTQPENYGNASGEALKFMYSLLELKAGLMETEFRTGFGEFVQAICRNLNISCEEVEQTWTRNMIRNDSENANICSSSVGIISDETIVRNHPFVENPQKELEKIKKEKAEKEENMINKFNPYFSKQSRGDDESGQQG